MPDYPSPGIHIEDVGAGPRPIEGVSTSTAAMLGPTERGPEFPVLVTSWREYECWFGGYLPLTESYLPYAVKGFFDNGGQRCVIARIVGDDTRDRPVDSREVGDLHVSAIGRGAWSHRILLRITPGGSADDGGDRFRLALLYYAPETAPDMAAFMASFVDPLDPASRNDPHRREPDAVEVYDDLVHTPGAPNFVGSVVNGASHLVRVWMTSADPSPVPTDALPDFVQLTTASADLSDSASITPVAYEGDLDAHDPTSDASKQLLGRGRGLAAIGAIDEVALVLAPDEVRFDSDDVTERIVLQCEQLEDRFAVVSARRGQQAALEVRPPFDTSYGAYYYPWIEVHDPVSHGPILIPPGGHVAGVIAATDRERGVHKAPANVVVRGASNLEFPVTQAMQEILNPRGVNCIRDFRAQGRGIRLWGARTMSSDPAWRYVNIRRYFIYLKKSIQEGTRWVILEPNGEPLWARVRDSVDSFLARAWRRGALVGQTQEDAFFVRCDRTTMTQDDIDNGRLICVIGVALVRPGEFVIFRIGQKTADAPG